MLPVPRREWRWRQSIRARRSSSLSSAGGFRRVEACWCLAIPLHRMLSQKADRLVGDTRRMLDDDAVAGAVDLDERHAVWMVGLEIPPVAGRRDLVLQTLDDEHRRRTAGPP